MEPEGGGWDPKKAGRTRGNRQGNLRMGPGSEQNYGQCSEAPCFEDRIADCRRYHEPGREGPAGDP